MTTKMTIESVVKEGLCTQCGWCVLSCPSNAISQRETPAGHLLPIIHSDKCTQCGICHRICPGWHVENHVSTSSCDKFEGPVMAAFCGYATSPEIREKSQSGGIVSALLSHQLKTDLTAGTVVCRMPQDGSLRPQAKLARSSEEVVKACGSKYCPVRFDEDLCKELSECQIVTVVGVSCQVQALRNLQVVSPQWRDRCGLVIGLVCDRIMSLLSIDQLCSNSGLGLADVRNFEYRSKRWKGWPGDVLVEDANGRKVFLPAKKRMEIKDVFTPARCRICFDKMNVFSDIALGDAHGLRTDKKGYSVVLARTQQGLTALRAAADAGVITLEPVSIEDVFKSQQIAHKRQEWAAYTKAWESMGHTAPVFHFAPDHRPVVEDESLTKQKKAVLHRIECLTSQPTRELALKVGRRQLLAQRARYWLSGKEPLRQVVKWLRKAIIITIK